MAGYGQGEKPLILITGADGTGAVSLPWNLLLAGAIGLSFLFTRLTMAANGAMADADHLLGALVVTVLAVAAAEVCRVARFALVPLGLAIAALAFPRGQITESYGTLDRVIR